MLSILMVPTVEYNPKCIGKSLLASWIHTKRDCGLLWKWGQFFCFPIDLNVFSEIV